MPNVLLTPKQLAESMKEMARKRVEEMPIESCRKIAAMELIGLGVGAALVASLMVACRERVAMAVDNA